MMTADQDAGVLWSRLLKPWEKILDDDVETWRKDCGFFVAFVTRCDQRFEFTLHGGNDEVLKDIALGSQTVEDAMTQGDSLISDFVKKGASVLSADEIRVTQLVMSGNLLYAVGTDGVVYRSTGLGTWEPMSMKV